MTDISHYLKIGYSKSMALVIGINQYQNTSPLSYAVNDANEFSEILINELGFERENVITLIDANANKNSILSALSRYTNNDINIDDALIVFFAGHGHTVRGIRGDVGYLVPVDANLTDKSTFIRWDELTRNAELIKAKHILFIMDACYSGLAVNRRVNPGSVRFLNDMYKRISRQVITAGKANEPVADEGGPLPDHSIFTGYLIQGIRGEAATSDGVITANSLMSYVYTKVSNDPDSNQTPHYGQIYGDGDFIVNSQNITVPQSDEHIELDKLISIATANDISSHYTFEELIEKVKKLLSEEKHSIELHDFSVGAVREFISESALTNFPVNVDYTDNLFRQRLAEYNKISKEMSGIIACIAYWGSEKNKSVLIKVIQRTFENYSDNMGGNLFLISLSGYPSIMMTYIVGVSCVESGRYDSLKDILYSEITTERGQSYLASLVSKFICKINETEIFKRIENLERRYTPLSDYLSPEIQPLLDDIFFVGKRYDECFDTFEILLAWVVADLNIQKGHNLWGPVGRFAWKWQRSHGADQYTILERSALEQRDNWPPIKAGMFGGDFSRLEVVMTGYRTDLMANLHWF